MKNIYHSLPLAILMTMFLSCVAPINSSFESARSLGKGNTEILGAYSHYGFSEEGESESTNNNFGFRLGYGLQDRLDLKFRFEYLKSKVKEDGANAVYLELAPKYGLVDKWLSASLPIGVYLYGSDETESTFVISPKMLMTYPASQQFELTFGGKMDFYLDEEAEFSDNTVGLNLGLSFSSDLDAWALRPEAGLLFNPGESGVYLSFGIGVTYNFFGKSAARKS